MQLLSKSRGICVDTWREMPTSELNYLQWSCRQVYGQWLLIMNSDTESAQRLQLSFRLLHSCFVMHSINSLLLFRFSKNDYKHLQAYWRCHRAFSDYKKLKKASLISQSRWKGRISRRELNKQKLVNITVLLLFCC